MAILRRDDGVQFVLQPYRELLPVKNKSLLKKELQHLSESYGSFARIFKNESGYEAIFARDSGYLLGEAIWRHLSKPVDLIYCEALTGKQQALVVIVRNNIVHLDNIINYADLAEELAFLKAEKTSFAMYVYGDVPVAEQAEAGKFSIDSAQVKAFTRLHSPLYTAITVTPELRLLSIERAIAELKLDQSKQLAMAGLVFIILFGIVIWWHQNTPATSEAVQNPLVAYQTALQSPGPAAQLNTLATQIAQAYAVPGWTPTKVNFSNGSAQFELHTMGSSLTGLLQWAAAQKVAVQLTNTGASLTLNQTLPARVAPANILRSQTILATVIDRVMQVLPGNTIKMGTTMPYGIYQETGITISLANVSPEILGLIGNELTNLPIVLSKGTLDLNNGLLSGTIQLSVLGN